MKSSSPAETTSNSGTWPALLAEFSMVIGFTYSNDLVEFVMDVANKPYLGLGQWLVFALDMLLVIGTAALKWLMEREHTDVATFLRRLLRGWWSVGATLVVVMHLMLIFSGGHVAGSSEPATLGVNLVLTLVFVAAMTMLLLSAHSETTGSRSWLVPLVFGTLVTQFASALWEPIVDVGSGCANNISSSYFGAAIDIIALTLLAIGVELSYFRRAAAGGDAAQRAAPVLTVILLCAGQMLALSMMVKADLGERCGTAAVWHEYMSFLVATQAMAVGLATMTWLLISDLGEQAAQPPKLGSHV